MLLEAFPRKESIPPTLFASDSGQVNGAVEAVMGVGENWKRVGA